MRQLCIFCVLTLTPLFADSTPFRDFVLSAQCSPDTKALYEETNYAPLWSSNAPAQKIAREVLATCDEDGLDPNDYKVDEKGDWMAQELSLTETFLKYITHIRQGRIPPRKVNNNIMLESKKTQAVDLLLQAIKSEEGFQKLRQLSPFVLDYQDLKAELKRYRNLAENSNNWPVLTAKTLKKGESGKDVEALAEILHILGDLKRAPVTDRFDEEIETAVKKFQERHTLDQDGVVGGKTREALNWPLQRQINKIIVNMERLRWLPDEPGDRYLLANIAGYEVRGVEENVIEIRMPAIVGTAGTKTPLFTSKMEEVTINPAWGVPPGIFARSKLPKIQEDPDYVRRAGFTVVDSSGIPVDPDTVDWDNDGFSYRLTQSPGKHNALGRIKLGFKNPYLIYMHGTPEQHLFAKASRAFSSGCIRLEDPIKLANWVLGENWPTEELQKAVNKGGTRSIPAEPMPVYITYLTAWVDDDGVVHFSDDIYKMDEQLIKMLKLEI